MRRTSLVALIAMLCLGLVAARTHPLVRAQESSTQGHALVGTWLLDADTADPSDAPSVVTFSSDGTYMEVSADHQAQLGAWEATGENTATLTIVSLEGDDNGQLFATVMVRASIEVSADGNAISATYTLEVVFPDGTSTGEAGPANAAGTRVAVEAPGTPSMTMDELDSMMEGDGGDGGDSGTDNGTSEEPAEDVTPSATPVS